MSDKQELYSFDIINSGLNGVEYNLYPIENCKECLLIKSQSVNNVGQFQIIKFDSNNINNIVNTNNFSEN